ncbi:hypothetical protein QW060_08240 [Myroides ceti]|uniref:Secreted protein n=1 Tax=Paenimyroides ceti TaxID=395087 RepID=A0ABT8CU13_9FLAO|nr:hypothetical protein [Paenimyroides ceti]MDN3707123.1 hypothetical protein [Paenimyroides ceti]
MMWCLFKISVILLILVAPSVPTVSYPITPTTCPFITSGAPDNPSNCFILLYCSHSKSTSHFVPSLVRETLPVYLPPEFTLCVGKP